jgi:hypothetical protein
MVTVCDAADGRELLTLRGHASRVRSVSWSLDEIRLAPGSMDGTAKVWEAARAEALQEWARQDRAPQELLGQDASRGPEARGPRAGTPDVVEGPPSPDR